MAERLKLSARDAGDLETIAAVLQDALVPLADMTYRRREGRFALMLNRFHWEAAPTEIDGGLPPPAEGKGDASYADQDALAFERVHAALIIEKVRAVKHRGLKAAARGGVLELLTISVDGHHLVLSFDGGAAVRLEVRGISCYLEDLGEPWPTVWRPQHSDSESSGGSP